MKKEKDLGIVASENADHLMAEGGREREREKGENGGFAEKQVVFFCEEETKEGKLYR